MEIIQQKKMLTFKQVSQITGLPLGTLYSLVHHKTIPHFRFGPKCVRFCELEIMEWIKNKKIKSQIQSNSQRHTIINSN
jgi:excisionase family DNA binding protein